MSKLSARFHLWPHTTFVHVSRPENICSCYNMLLYAFWSHWKHERNCTKNDGYFCTLRRQLCRTASGSGFWHGRLICAISIWNQIRRQMGSGNRYRLHQWRRQQTLFSIAKTGIYVVHWADEAASKSNRNKETKNSVLIFTASQTVWQLVYI